MSKRQRTDTAAGAVAAMLDAMPVEIPAHIQEQLNPEGVLHWGIITRAKAKSLWTENDLELAAELTLARQEKSKIRKLVSAVEQDENEHPARIMRAVLDADKQIDVLVKREERLTRLLQIHAEATVGKARDQVKKNTAAKDSRQTMDSASSLIARPTH